MDTAIWGPQMWSVLHHVAFHLPHTEHAARMSFCDMMRCLEHVMPCRSCRDTFKIFWKVCPLRAYDLNPANPQPCPDGTVLQHRALSFVWYYHNLVSTKLNKTTLPLETLVNRMHIPYWACTPEAVIGLLACVAHVLPDADDRVRKSAVQFDTALMELIAHNRHLDSLQSLAKPCLSGSAKIMAKLSRCMRRCIEHHPQRAHAKQKYDEFITHLEECLCGEGILHPTHQSIVDIAEQRIKVR